MDRPQSFGAASLFAKGTKEQPSDAEQDNQPLRSIREMAREFDVSVRALRFYEDRGLLHPARKGTARFYDETDRHNLRLILKGKRLGFTLSEIHGMLQGHPSQARGSEHHKAELELRLLPEQIIAQISHLERQHNALEEALAALRLAHQKLTDHALRAPS